MYVKLHTSTKLMNSSNIRTIMELIPSIQNYDWGKRGTASKVANLFKNINPGFVIEPNTPYAELWMGTHVNGPSLVKKLNKSLSSVLDEHPQYLGRDSLEMFGKTLPYLLKVLSIEKALSIQVHPSKNHATKLHSTQPQLYKDANHKPELAIALSPFEALCGFRPSTEIRNFFNIIPELQNLIGKQLCNDYIKDPDEKNLKICFRALMTSSDDKLKQGFQSLTLRFSKLDLDGRQDQLSDLLERLYKQYPDDVGCFVVYFLNYVQLKPLEAIYLGSNEPHAYISGECVECMACSDNVVRAGLTPKYKDVDTLCEMLNYQGAEAKYKIFVPIEENKQTVIFRPPVSDFAVAKIEIPSGASDLLLVSRESGSILLVIYGTAATSDINLTSGTSIFIPAESEVNLQNVSQGFLAFQAMTNINV